MHQTSKLEYILIRVLSTLYSKGFCVPKESDGKSKGEEKFRDNVDGTGMGEGEGNKVRQLLAAFQLV